MINQKEILVWIGVLILGVILVPILYLWFGIEWLLSKIWLIYMRTLK